MRLATEEYSGDDGTHADGISVCLKIFEVLELLSELVSKLNVRDVES